MPNLFKLLARNLVLGVVAGWITLALLIATNTAGLSDVVFGSSTPLLPIAILAFGFTITFGSLSMGAAIMLMPYDKGDSKDKGLKVHMLLASLKNRIKGIAGLGAEHTLIPIPVKDKSQHSRFHR